MAEHILPIHPQFIPDMRDVVAAVEPGDTIVVCEEEVRTLLLDHMFARLRPGFDASQVQIVVDPERVNREMEAQR